MSLTAGTKLGPYEILAPIGAGTSRHSERSEESRTRSGSRLVEYGVPRRSAPRNDRLMAGLAA